MTVTNKRLLISESHDNSNRCTPCRENPTNTSHAFHAQSKTIRGPHIATFCESSTALDRVTTPEKKGLPTQSTTRRLTDPGGPYPVSLPSQPIKQWRKSNIYKQWATRLAEPINTSMRSVRLILAHEGQLIGP
jgi:hypothetical protein